MLFSVPQFIDIEDKIVGPLTAKQLGWMFIAGILLLIAWVFLNSIFFLFAVLLIAIAFGALAFYKPHDQPMVNFIASSLSFATKPKIYIWKRNYDNIKMIERKNTKKEEKEIIQHNITKEEIKEISEALNKGIK